jgi:hypothetical protein
VEAVLGGAQVADGFEQAAEGDGQRDDRGVLVTSRPGEQPEGQRSQAELAGARARPGGASVQFAAGPVVGPGREVRAQGLGVVHSELIDRYQERVADDLDPIGAMVVATVVLTPTPDDVNGAAAARAVAGDERGEALRDSAVPDVATTPSVDEHTQGIHAGATHAAVSDAAAARAALLAAQAYTQPLRAGLARALHASPPQPRYGRDRRYNRGR